MPHDKVRLFETVGWVMVWPVEIVHWRRWAASASLFVFGAMPLYLEFIRPACPLSYAGQIARRHPSWRSPPEGSRIAPDLRLAHLEGVERETVNQPT